MAINLANNNSLANITALPSSISGGGMTLISEQTASGSATISFTSGIDSTYDSYVFKFYDIHGSADNSDLTFNGSTDSGSNYNTVKTTTMFRAIHSEGGDTTLGYDTGGDLAQSTSFQSLIRSIGIDNDQCGVGTLHLYNPSSTVFVKHFIQTSNSYGSASNDYSRNQFFAGYMNTTSAVDAVQFKMSSGNIDSGVIKLYGVS
jgi:hypothetical protein